MLYKCKECGYECNSLKKHLHKHKMKLNEYLNKFDEYEQYNKWSEKKKIERRKNSPLTIDFWLSRGYSKEEAILESEKVKEKTRNKAREPKNIITNKKYWLSRGYSEDESIMNIEREKLKYSASKKNLISKYGEKEGIRIYEERAKKQAKTFIKTITAKHRSNDKKIALSENGKLVSSFSPVTMEGAKRHNITEEERYILARKLSPRCIEFWKEKGHNAIEAELKVLDFQDNISIDYYFKKYGNEGFSNWKQKQGITGFDTFEKYQKSKKRYYSVVWRITNFYYNLYNHLFSERNMDNHLDHKYAIIEGFKNNIDPYLIASPYNLEILDAYENRSKQNTCSLILEELKTLHKNNKLNLELINEN